MKNITILNYQGNKASLMPFIKNEIDKIALPGDTIIDIFSGSGSVSNGLKDTYKMVANDAELYSSIITSALLTSSIAREDGEKLKKLINDLYTQYFFEKSFGSDVDTEEKFLNSNNTSKLLDLYNAIPTVWKNQSNVTPSILRKKNENNLFQFYYAGSYFGLSQAIEIDTIILIIKELDLSHRNLLFSCLFYAMKEASFSKDGHMAQPLNIHKNTQRHLKQRKKKIIDLFFLKFDEFLSQDVSNHHTNDHEHVVLNNDFLEILSEDILKYNPKIIYADPPYTDMQYSRYYHLLNVAANYNYPELTTYRGGYTNGLYTEGRNQSSLSQRSKAKTQLRKLLEFAKTNNIKVVLSYAFPENEELQATNRYTVTIEELIDMAKDVFNDNQVYWEKAKHKHANHRNSTQKKVYEYLIICGQENKYKVSVPDLRNVKENIKKMVATSRNDMYNSHLYWSQKSYNVIDELITGLSKKGEIVFDPFLGSGVTVLESIKKGTDRIGIGCDVNAMPLFISETLLKDMFNAQSLRQLETFSKDIKDLEKFYKTHCPICGNEGTITKVIFDKPSRLNNDNVEIHSISYNCTCGNNNVKKPDIDDYKNMLGNPGDPQNVNDEQLIRNSKIAVGENDKISFIFTPRNFHVLDSIVGIINSYEKPNIVNYLLMSVLHLSKISDTHSNSQWPLWIPKINCVEKNIIHLLEKRIKKLKKAENYVKENYMPDSLVSHFDFLAKNKALLLKKGSQFITEEEVQNNSVSLIITDPPYMEQVLYSEYMQLYKPFLGLEFNLEDEIVVSSSPLRKKSKFNYFQLLDEVFYMCSKKLKEDGYMCLFFHDSDLNVWNNLIEILEKNGFKFVSQEHIRKSKTVKNILSPKKSLNGDAILFFKNIKKELSYHETTTALPIIEKSIYDQTKVLIEEHGPLSTPELYDNGLMEVLIENGWLKKFSEKYKSLVDFFEIKLIWQKDNSKWSLK